MNEVTKINEGEAPLVVADPMVSMIERVLTNPDADLAKLTAMLEMKERLDAQKARRSFDMAISQAKSGMTPILKTGIVDYENSKGDRTFFKHETLDGIAKVIDPILSEHGLSYRFRSHQEAGQLHVTCVVAHQDGHFEETSLQGAPDASGAKNNYQALGSAVTYLQRYTLKLALGLSAAKDDEAAMVAQVETITPEQIEEIEDLAERAGVKIGVILTANKVNAIHDLPVTMYKSVSSRLNINIANRGASNG